ncbi:MAG: hypothetical protein V1720_18315 [bacterium]
MKKILFLLLIWSGSVFSQAGYICFDHPVYDFLERMNVLHIIQDYDSAELPKSRKEIAGFLGTIKDNKNLLNQVDKDLLADFLSEFEYDVEKTTTGYQSFYPDFNLENLISGKEKFLYYYTDTNKVAFFANLQVDIENLFANNRATNKNTNAMLYSYHGILTGSFFDNYGFYFKTGFGAFSGDKSLALTKNNLRYNYKFNLETPGSVGGELYDETEGFLCADFEFIKFKIGRDRKTLGYGREKYLLSNEMPAMDYLSLNINYSIFSFSYLHGKLLGNISVISDSLQGEMNTVSDKFYVYHRFGFNFSKHFSLGAGEALIYSRRGLDLSYLNPFNYFKSVEHANQDRDNSLLFIDASNNSLPGLKLHAAVLIDDLDFGKIGNGWYGNQTLWSFGLYSSNLYQVFPVDISLQYLRIEPYFYTHRILENNFTSEGAPVATSIPPNSQCISATVYLQPFYRLRFGLSFRYAIHGANEVDEEGNIIRNHGGDISVGYRLNDPEQIKFMDGDKEYLRSLNFRIQYEPLNNYNVIFNLMYNNDHLHKSKRNEMIYSSLLLRIII